MDKDLLANFRYFVEERWEMHIRKDIDKVPPHMWTRDEILKTYRFCNVQREDDRVTRWISRNWRQPNDGHKTLPQAMLLARIINVPGTLQEIGYPWLWEKDKFLRIIMARMARGDKTWTSAYMVTGTESKGMSKAEYTSLIMERALPYLQYLPTSSLAEASAALQQVKGISSFLSGQVIADLKYTSQWKDAKDWWTFAEPGPGSIRGLHRLHGRSYTVGMGVEQFTEELNELHFLVDGQMVGVPALHNQDLQNCLCEWDKYQRALHQQGTPKQHYIPSMEAY